MKYLSYLIFVLLIAFFISFTIGRPIISYLTKKKVGQPILEYVKKHNSKYGTPTMGGIIFIISFIIVSVLFINGIVKNIYICLLFVLGNASIGIYDDILKISNKKNLGLKPYQKIIFQFTISILLGIYLYLNGITTFVLPFSKLVINIKYWIIILTPILSIFFINSVNLTDGLDGLVSFITLTVLGGLGAILWLILRSGVFETSQFVNFYENFGLFVAIFFGAILGYIFYNCYPAKIFMGDTGSLSIGAFLISISLFTGTTIFLFLIGIMYVVSGVSVILQVAYYKITHKRVFLMAPIHHHFELKGVHESKITTTYFLITLVISLGVILVESFVI